MIKVRHLLWLLSVVIVAYVLFSVHRPVVSSRDGMVLRIEPGTSISLLQKKLAAQNLNPLPLAFRLYTLFYWTKSLKAGEYLIPYQASLANIWQQVIQGKGLYYRRVVIVPGMTCEQMQHLFAAQPGLTKQAQSWQRDAEWRKALAYPDKALEGQLMPETYTYTYGESVAAILQQAAQLMKKFLLSAWQTRANDLPFTDAYQALIAASIVEKEAYLATELPIIAGVLVNRLNKNMRLQFDPTIIYGLGSRYQGKLHKSDLQLDTPYNTYLHGGLTPTPIAMPSATAINAVLHPAVHDYYYFVAKGDGSHQFSATLKQHQQAVRAAIKKSFILPQSFLNEFYLKQIILMNL